ncbi:MAG: CBS domain-containing protein [Candidatus Hodarchaeota archaeon]
MKKISQEEREGQLSVWSEREEGSFPQLNLSAPASKAMHLIESGFHSIIVTEDDDRTYEGMVNEFDLLRRRVNPKITMKTVFKSIPPLKKNKPLIEAAHLLLASGYRRLPIVDENYRVIGSISDRKVLFAIVDDYFQDQMLGELYNEGPTTYMGETCGRLLSLMRDENVSHVPVFDDENKLTGIITSHELVTQFLQPLKKSPEATERVGQKLGVAIDSLVRKTPVMLPANTPLKEALTMMKEQKISSVLVISDDETESYLGIVTIRDLLRRFMSSIDESELDYRIRISGEPDEDVKEISFKKSLRLLERYSAYLGEAGDINIRFRKIEYQSKRGMFQYECSARLTSNRGHKFSVSAVDFGGPNALNTCIARLTRVIENKRTHSRRQKKRKEQRVLKERM